MIKNKQFIFNIPVEYRVRGFLQIKASDIKEACKIAKIPPMGKLSDEICPAAEYIKNSWRVEEKECEDFQEQNVLDEMYEQMDESPDEYFLRARDRWKRVDLIQD